MRVMTVFGTRPELIRLSRILNVLDSHCEHITVHTGQNFHEGLSDIFIRDLGIREPDEHLGIKATGFADQFAQIIKGVDDLLVEHQPEKVLILGDTNSALSAIACARRGIPVFHMEAGNRCYDDRVPEEINRRIIDHSSTILLPYTERSKENLVREGIPRERIFVIGNPINEVLKYYSSYIDASTILNDLGVRKEEYFLATLHRAENVDSPERLKNLIAGLIAVTEEFGVDLLISVHPRTAEKLGVSGISMKGTRIRLLDPLGFFDFVKLEISAKAVLTDSGTVQEECAIFGVPNVTIRDVTERPETIACGSNIISGADPDVIVKTTKVAVSTGTHWEAPIEYSVANSSQIVAKIILGYTSTAAHR